MLLERGIAVSYETIRRWGRKHGPGYARRIRRLQQQFYEEIAESNASTGAVRTDLVKRVGGDAQDNSASPLPSADCLNDGSDGQSGPHSILETEPTKAARKAFHR